jgi:hypothetical protein
MRAVRVRDVIRRGGFDVIKHIVVWRLKDEALGATREENIVRLKAALEALPAVVPGIAEFEVGVPRDRDAGCWDIALYSAFPTWTVLDGYQVHPEHVKVKELVGRLTADRAVIDYEV